MNRNIVLVCLTVVLLLGAFFMFFNDRNSAVLDRTLQYELTDDMQIVQMKKHGSVFSRSSYEARIRIDANNPEAVVERIATAYDFAGALFPPLEYADLATQIFDGITIIPHPEEKTSVWVMSCIDDNGHEITHIMCAEGPGEAYLYIYYNK